MCDADADDVAALDDVLETADRNAIRFRIPAIHFAVMETFAQWIVTGTLARVFDPFYGRFHDCHPRCWSHNRKRSVVFEDGPRAKRGEWTSWHGEFFYFFFHFSRTEG